MEYDTCNNDTGSIVTHRSDDYQHVLFALIEGFIWGMYFPLGIIEYLKSAKLKQIYKKRFLAEMEYEEIVLFGKIKRK